MRLLLAGVLATLTAASLAIIRPALLTEDEREATQSMRESRWRADVRFLSSDLLEGRAPGTRGDQLAREYVAARFEAIGLEPGAQGGAWEQPVELVGVRSRAPRELRVARGKDERDAASSRTTTSPGATAARRSRGSTTPRSSSSATASSPPSTSGTTSRAPTCKRQGAARHEQRPGATTRARSPARRRLYYGRWDYKYEIAAARGRRGRDHHPHDALGRLPLVRSCRTPGRASSSSLPPRRGRGLQVKAWATEEACRRIARLGGQDLDALRAAAPRARLPAGAAGRQRSSLRLENEVARTQTRQRHRPAAGQRPAAREGGGDLHRAPRPPRQPAEAEAGDDRIYNGALDNAVGRRRAARRAREAFAALPAAPARARSCSPRSRPRSRDCWARSTCRATAGAAGPRRRQHQHRRRQHLGPHPRRHRSSASASPALDDWVEALAEHAGAHASCPSQFPDRGFFYRSDQFNFARIGVPVGVPRRRHRRHRQAARLGQGAARGVRGHALPPAVRRADAGLGPVGRGRGRAAAVSTSA